MEAAASAEERVGDGEAPEALAEVTLNFLMSLLPMVGNRYDDIEFVRRVLNLIGCKTTHREPTV